LSDEILGTSSSLLTTKPAVLGTGSSFNLVPFVDEMLFQQVICWHVFCYLLNFCLDGLFNQTINANGEIKVIGTLTAVHRGRRIALPGRRRERSRFKWKLNAFTATELSKPVQLII